MPYFAMAMVTSEVAASNLECSKTLQCHSYLNQKCHIVQWQTLCQKLQPPIMNAARILNALHSMNCNVKRQATTQRVSLPWLVAGGLNDAAHKVDIRCAYNIIVCTLCLKCPCRLWCGSSNTTIKHDIWNRVVISMSTVVVNGSPMDDNDLVLAAPAEITSASPSFSFELGNWGKLVRTGGIWWCC